MLSSPRAPEGFSSPPLTHNLDISRKKHFKVTVGVFSRLSAPLCRLTWESDVKHRGRKGSCNPWDLHVKIQSWLALLSSSLKKMYEPGFVGSRSKFFKLVKPDYSMWKINLFLGEFRTIE